MRGDILEQLNEILKLDWQIMQAQKKCTQQILEEHSVYYAQAPILHALKTLGECSQASLADFLATSPASVAVSLNRLSKLELIKRQANKNDLRYNTVSLTKKGMEAANLAESTLFTINQKKFEGFSDEDVKTFINYKKRILENLKKKG